jgi:hypothetical protein
MQKTIFIEKRYDLFWDEFYNFIIRVNFEYEKYKDERIQELLKELEEKKLIFVPNFSNFFKRTKIKQIEGRPSKITIDILLEFADYLEENRKDKKHNLNELLKMAAENKMESTTIRNWLRNYMTLLNEPKKSILELNKDDILFMWTEYQKGRRNPHRKRSEVTVRNIK